MSRGSDGTAGLLPHERRVCRRLEARGEPGLGEALARFDGQMLGRRFRIDSLYAVGAEGAVYLATDTGAPGTRLVAKVPLHPLHRPFDLTEDEIRRRREGLRDEATHLEEAGSRYMPRMLGLLDAPSNPAMENDWGGAFSEPEPVMIMEKLPGFDLDLWLARMHGSRVPKQLLRRNLDHVAVVVLSALMELQEKGFFYCDLRPGNVRIRGRSRERVRLMDAGSLVRMDDRSGRFPHVPAYLPAALFAASRAGETILPAADVQAVMAGRTLFEVATGRVPLPGMDVDVSTLYATNVSPSVAETIDGLCRGQFADVTEALAFLSKNHVPAPEPEAPTPQTSAIQRLTNALSRAGTQPATAPGLTQRDRQPAPAEAESPKPVRDLHSVLAAARKEGATRPAETQRPATIGRIRAIDDAAPSRPDAPAASRPAPTVPDAGRAAPTRRHSVVPEDPLAPMPLAQSAASRPSRSSGERGVRDPSPQHLRALSESRTAVAQEEAKPTPAAAPRPAVPARGSGAEARPSPAKPAMTSTSAFLRETAESPDVLPPARPRPWWKRMLARFLGL